jgi:hypothetical protein
MTSTARKIVLAAAAVALLGMAACTPKAPATNNDTTNTTDTTTPDNTMGNTMENTMTNTAS